MIRILWQQMWRRLWMLILPALLVGACTMPNVPGMPELSDMPEIPDLTRLTDIPGIPRELADVPNLLQELGLGDLANLEDLPGLDTLPFLRSEPGALVLRGPVERGVQVGERIPGTDIVLQGITEEGAVFEIAGMRSVRTYADSLDFDGDWPGVPGVSYNLRLRLYQISRDRVRAAGVHQVGILNVAPVVGGAQPGTPAGQELSFPSTWGLAPGAAIPGTTFTYVGVHERGAEIGGLGEGIYPYHKLGDSVRWHGQLRPDIAADYQLRMLAYGADSARVGGIVTIYLPAP
ncbi:MAG: hypothetical protein WDZ49_01630 [Litorilinea sp.]